MFERECQRPDADRLAAVRGALAARAERTSDVGPWMSGAFAELAAGGVLAGFVPPDCGGAGAGEEALVETLKAIAEACLTTALVLSQ
ncbi:MAG: hypothetical protein EBZ59_10300, partial [Planctomycetia bacterium]|nr:hypothetical protein [Planctomycetia bacterium]